MDQRGEKNHGAILTRADVRKIRRFCRMQYTNMAIGEAFGVHHSMISRIRLAKSWGLKKPITRKYSSICQTKRAQASKLDRRLLQEH